MQSAILVFGDALLQVWKALRQNARFPILFADSDACTSTAKWNASMSFSFAIDVASLMRFSARVVL